MVPAPRTAAQRAAQCRVMAAKAEAYGISVRKRRPLRECVRNADTGVTWWGRRDRLTKVRKAKRLIEGGAEAWEFTKDDVQAIMATRLLRELWARRRPGEALPTDEGVDAAWAAQLRLWRDQGLRPASLKRRMSPLVGVPGVPRGPRAASLVDRQAERIAERRAQRRAALASAATSNAGAANRNADNANSVAGGKSKFSLAGLGPANGLSEGELAAAADAAAESERRHRKNKKNDGGGSLADGVFPDLENWYGAENGRKKGRNNNSLATAEFPELERWFQGVAAAQAAAGKQKKKSKSAKSAAPPAKSKAAKSKAAASNKPGGAQMLSWSGSVNYGPLFSKSTAAAKASAAVKGKAVKGKAVEGKAVKGKAVNNNNGAASSVGDWDPNRDRKNAGKKAAALPMRNGNAHSTVGGAAPRKTAGAASRKNNDSSPTSKKVRLDAIRGAAALAQVSSRAGALGALCGGRVDARWAADAVRGSRNSPGDERFALVAYDPDARTTRASAAGAEVGVAIGRFARGTRSVARVAEVHLLCAARGYPVGGLVLRELEAYVAARGAGMVLLKTVAHPATVAFYRKQGYARTPDACSPDGVNLVAARRDHAAYVRGGAAPPPPHAGGLAFPENARDARGRLDAAIMTKCLSASQRPSRGPWRPAGPPGRTTLGTWASRAGRWVAVV